MTPTELVPPLALCQQLRDKGFPQDTAMAWFIAKPDGAHETCLWVQTPGSQDDCVAAPTASELEEWLSVNNLRRFITAYYEPYEPIERRWSVASDLAKKPERNLSTCRAETLVSALAALVLEVAG